MQVLCSRGILDKRQTFRRPLKHPRAQTAATQHMLTTLHWSERSMTFCKLRVVSGYGAPDSVWQCLSVWQWQSVWRWLTLADRVSDSVLTVSDSVWTVSTVWQCLDSVNSMTVSWQCQQCLDSVNSIWQCPDSVNSVWQCLDSVNSIWQHLDSVNSVWQCLDSVNSVWQCIDSVNSIWQRLDSVNSIWQCLDSVNSVWQCLNSQCQTMCDSVLAVSTTSDKVWQRQSVWQWLTMSDRVSASVWQCLIECQPVSDNVWRLDSVNNFWQCLTKTERLTVIENVWQSVSQCLTTSDSVLTVSTTSDSIWHRRSVWQWLKMSERVSASVWQCLTECQPVSDNVWQSVNQCVTMFDSVLTVSTLSDSVSSVRQCLTVSWVSTLSDWPCLAVTESARQSFIRFIKGGMIVAKRIAIQRHHTAEAHTLSIVKI